MKKLSLISGLLGLSMLAFTACGDVSGVQSGDKVSLIELVDSVGVEMKDIRIQPGAPYQVNVNVLPASAKNKNVSYESSSRHVFTVDENGLITPENYGKASLIVRSKDGSRVVANYDVYVVKFITEFGFTNLAEGERLFTGDSMLIKYDYAPVDATITELTYSASLPEGVEGDVDDVLTVGADGMIRIEGPGSAIISATTTDGSMLTKSVAVNVEPKILTESIAFTVDTVFLKEFRSVNLAELVTVTPENASYNGRYKFSVSYLNVVDLDAETGDMFGLQPGTLTVRVETTDGSYLQDHVYVKVSEGSKSVDREGWTPWAQSYYNDSYPPSKGIDSDQSSFWHTSETTGKYKLPHWYMIDMGQVESFYKWQIWRSTGSQPDMKDAIVFVSEEVGDVVTDDATAKAFAETEANWIKIGAVDFESDKSGIRTLWNTYVAPVSSRYIKIEFPNSSRKQESTNPVKICDFQVYTIDE